MFDYRLYRILKDIIDVAYPETENTNFKKFYIDIIPKEMKSKHGEYNPKEKKIKIYNLSRPSEHIITTAIHEVSHHIDCYLRNSSDHSKEFYEIMYKLLVAAIGMGIINKDAISTEVDSKDKDRLVKYFGDIDTWEIQNVKYKNDIKTFKVTNCFDIKDKLKARGYRYVATEQCWIKDIAIDCAEEEKSFLKSIIDMENVKIVSANEINIQVFYYICVLNSYEYKDYLKENGFIYNGFGIKKKSWNKKVLAHDAAVEVEKLNDLTNATIKVISKTQKNKAKSKNKE